MDSKEMTIREEIFRQEKNFDLGITSDDVLYEHADSILKLFEKVIEGKILSMECWKAEYQLNDKEFQTILQILKELKEELSK